MNDPERKARIKKMAHDWYVGKMPTRDVAMAHFAKMAREHPTHTMDYTAALGCFLADAANPHFKGK
jgi:chlorite dismutase